MNRVVALAAVLAMLLAPALPVHTGPVADAGAIVAAEHAFAADVAKLGVREGFLRWLAPSSVVFRPGPVNGRASYSAMPAGGHGLLSWQPIHAAVSAAGDMGWSTGPWIWQRDSTQRKPDAFGDYMSVWRRQPDGTWKAVLDCGIGHAEPGRADTALTYSAPVPGTSLGSRPLAARQSLYQADASFARFAASEGVAGALARYATDDIIVLREGAQRFKGRSMAHDSLAARERQARLVSYAQYVARSGDLGYTYGSFVSGSSSTPDSAWYVHVWHRGAAATWRMAFQVVMPVPKKK